VNTVMNLPGGSSRRTQLHGVSELVIIPRVCSSTLKTMTADSSKMLVSIYEDTRLSRLHNLKRNFENE
jgi:hypothetical protein